MAIFADRKASPNEIARELDMSVSDVSYHVRTLRDAGTIELVGERAVRGSVEHFYRARSIAGPILSAEDYKRMTSRERCDFARHTFQLAVADASVSLEAQTFGKRHDHHVARVPFSIDEEGWKELGDLHNQMLSRILQIQSESDARREESGHAPIRGIAFSSFFETPRDDPREAQAA
jgi:hypothetical protein